MANRFLPGTQTGLLRQAAGFTAPMTRAHLLVAQHGHDQKKKMARRKLAIGRRDNRYALVHRLRLKDCRRAQADIAFASSSIVT